MAVKIQIRGGTAAEWTSANPILAAREMGIETDTDKFKFGDGTTAWTSLAYVGTSGAGQFQGVYASEGALTTAHPTGEPGDYAYVDAGVANPVQLWIWDEDDTEWVQSGTGGTVTSVSGTASRITSTGGATPIIDIDAAYDAAITAEIAAAIEARAISWEVPFGDESSPITATTAKLTFYWPYDNTTVSSIWAGLTVVQTSGSIFTVDVNKNGTTMLSTKITIDNGEDTSLTAATQPVLSVTTLSRGDKVVIDVDQVGDATAKGGKIVIDFTRS